MAGFHERVVHGQKPDQFRPAVPDMLHVEEGLIGSPSRVVKRKPSLGQGADTLLVELRRAGYRKKELEKMVGIYDANFDVALRTIGLELESLPNPKKGKGVVYERDRETVQIASERGWIELLPTSDRMIIKARSNGQSLAAVKESGNSQITPKTRWGIAKAEKRVLAMWRRKLAIL